MNVFNYCNQCKKSLNSDNFDKKKNGDFYTRCKICRTSHNNNEKKRYVKKCTKKSYCDNEKCEKCYNNSFASFTKKTLNGKLKTDCWHLTKNGEKNPRNIAKSSNKKYWFNCDVCDHDFDSSLNMISGNNTWCPYCCNQKLCKNNNCKHCYNNSFFSYFGKTKGGKLKVDCWHLTKNSELLPREVTKSSSKKYWFNCDVCDHDFYSGLANISGKMNTWCPYCAKKKICNNEKCKKCYNCSFASYIGKTINKKLKVDCWHLTKNGEKNPRNVAKSSGKKYWFNCDVCNHDFSSCLGGVSGSNNWCPYCCHNPKLCDDGNCKHCCDNSFSSYNKKTISGKLKVDCWHLTKNKEKNPRKVAKSSGKKYWFSCDICSHDFYSSLNDICGSNSWCPNCKNKTELKLYNWLLKQKNIKKVKKEYTPKWCSTEFRYINKEKELKKKRYQYRYDFLITFNNKKQLIIELDGRQHFKQVSNWKSPFEQQIRDKHKEFKARKYKIPLIRCLQEDVYMDKNNWEVSLKKQLEESNVAKLFKKQC
mgnify:CR=1 FL=1